MHGGHPLKLLDQVAYACASRYAGRYVVTVSVDQVLFRQPIHVGELVSFLATVNHTGRSSSAAEMLTGAARADEVKILTTGILKGAFTPIAAQFERQTGHKVTMSRGPSSGNSPEASPVRVRSGEVLDVLIMVDTGVDDLVRSGHFVPQHRRNVAVSRIDVAVKAGRPLPDISTVDAFRRALLDAKRAAAQRIAAGARHHGGGPAARGTAEAQRRFRGRVVQGGGARGGP